MDKHYQIMSKNLTQRFIDRCNVGLASETVSKLALHHTKSGFDIRPLVIVLQEVGAAELKVVIHLCPCSATVSYGIGLKSDEWNGTDISDCSGIFSRSITFISGDLRNLKILCGRVHKSREQGAVSHHSRIDREFLRL